MKINFNHFKNLLLEAYSDKKYVDMDDIDVNELAKRIVSNLKMFKDILRFFKMNETEDYINIQVNAENPNLARQALSSFKFSQATGVIIEPLQKSRKNGYQLIVYDEDGDPLEKDIFIRIRKGGEYNAGVKNEMDFINIIQNIIDNDQDCIMFEGRSGKLVEQNSYIIRNIESVRDCSKDAGSRTGNRADIEIISKDGIKHRISLKKDNAFKFAGLVKHFANQSYKIGKIVRKYFIDKNIPFINRYISIKITNPELYRWCLFGNDIDKNGGVIVCDANTSHIEEHKDCALIPVSDVILPTENILSLIDEFPIYIFMKMTKRGTVEILYATLPHFAKRYLIDDLVIPGIND